MCDKEPSTLTITFQVKDDLTSEKVAEYKQVIVDALDDYYGGTQRTRTLADKMLNDYYR
jgi:hypothetical protein